MEERDLGDLQPGELLDHAEALARAQREAEVAILRVARQHAVLNDAAIKAADPAAAAERERAERKRQFANPTQSTEDGMRGFYVRGPFHIITKLDAMVAYLAQLLLDLGDDSALDERRVKAVALLTSPHDVLELIDAYRRWIADQRSAVEKPSAEQPSPRETSDSPPVVDWSKFLPAVTLYAHLYAGVETTGVARIEGHGPLTHQWVREFLGPEARFTIRPVLDIEGQAPVDAYEIPDRHRQAVHLMMPADTFPYSKSLSRSQHLDHTIAFTHGEGQKGAGQSRVGNYGKVTVLHHRIKTFARWQVNQPFPGIYVWRDPYGAYYLVDHTGTRRLDAAS